MNRNYRVQSSDEGRKMMDDRRKTRDDGRIRPFRLRQGFGGQPSFVLHPSSIVLRPSSLILLLSFCLLSGCGTGAEYRILTEGEDIQIKSPQKNLTIGEKFTYKAEWLGMDVGIATLSVQEIMELNGRKVYHIVSVARTTPVISKIYKVEDRISTYLDVENLYPLRFEKKQREGAYRSDEYTDFDQNMGKAYYFSRLNKTKKEFNIPKKVQDPLSCLYYLRLQDVNIGKSIFANVNTDEKNYLLEAKVLKKAFVKVDGVGEWDAFMVEPLPWFQGKIKRKAKATIWLSADEKRIPLVVITSGIPFVGSIRITLQKVENFNETTDYSDY